MSIDDYIQPVVKAAKESRERFWTGPNAESEGDKQASRVTRAWQNQLLRSDHNRYRSEVPMAPHARERIDLVDETARIAFEFKVSANNPHHEFYKDVFKVLVYNRAHKDNPLKQFVFITEKDAAFRLSHSELAIAVFAMSSDLGFNIWSEGV